MTFSNDTSDPKEPEENWLRSGWRPAMAWLYFVICGFDFIVFPIVSSVIYSTFGDQYHEWHPLTLQGGGLFHMAMGAILSVTSYQRSQEKIKMGAYPMGPSTDDRREDTMSRPSQPVTASRAD